jgi:hypothetical protein
VLGLEVNDDYLATEATDLAGVAHHRAVVADDNRADPGEVLDRLLLLVAQALERPFAAGRRAVAEHGRCAGPGGRRRSPPGGTQPALVR